jgi:uroporphyrinogen-III decarboxylase
MPPETLTKTERVFAALRGEDVDRVPVSAWWHDFPREWAADSLAEATLEAYRKYGWDFVKVNPRACYYAEDWGALYVIADGANKQPVLTEPGISSPEHLDRIKPLDVSKGAYGEQLETLRLVGAALAGEAPFIQTVFSPLAVVTSPAPPARPAPLKEYSTVSGSPSHRGHARRLQPRLPGRRGCRDLLRHRGVGHPRLHLAR